MPPDLARAAGASPRAQKVLQEWPSKLGVGIERPHGHKAAVRKQMGMNRVVVQHCHRCRPLPLSSAAGVVRAVDSCASTLLLPRGVALALHEGGSRDRRLNAFFF